MNPADPQALPPQPDILLIIPDQMRSDCLSVLGHPAIVARQFDRLAEQGALLWRAYSTVASCLPARFPAGNRDGLERLAQYMAG